MAIEVVFETHSTTVDNEGGGPPAGCPVSCRFLADLKLRWGGQRVLVIGHTATRWGLEHYLRGARLENLAGGDFAWQAGWEYVLR